MICSILKLLFSLMFFFLAMMFHSGTHDQAGKEFDETEKKQVGHPGCTSLVGQQMAASGQHECILP